jgi:hypothetical protein
MSLHAPYAAEALPSGLTIEKLQRIGKSASKEEPPPVEGATKLAKVDLTKLLNTSIVKRTTGGHACEAGTLPASVVSIMSVP